MPPKPIPLTKKDVLAAAREVAATEHNPSRSKIASRLGMVESTLNKKARDKGWVEEIDRILHPPVGAEIEAPGVTENDDGTASVVSDPDASKLWTPDGLLRHYGMDPDEWEIVRARPNVWGDPADPRHQLRLDLIPRRLLIVAPDPGKWKPPPKPKKHQGAEGKVVVCGDFHFPQNDPGLHRLFLDYLADVKPERGIINGDLLDFHTISRFREREGFAAPVNECIQTAFAGLLDIRHASPDTRWTLMLGNHDFRLESQIIDNVKGLHKITAANSNVPALSLRQLLHLDDLGIDFVDEDWDRARWAVTGKLTVRHGAFTGKNATEKLLAKFTRSTVQGHTHRLSVKYRTEHTEEEDDPTETRLAAESGCMCVVKDSLGYGHDEDWNQGFLVVNTWKGGEFSVTPAVYASGRLFVGERRYGA